WRGCVLLSLLLVVVGSVRSLKYSITTTWNGDPITRQPPVNLTLTASPDGRFLYLDIVAPFFNDPPQPDSPPGQPFFGLWDYEVVEAFFLNDQNQYVEVEVCPWGQHIVLLLSGQRVTIRHSLPLTVTTQRTADTWTGRANIPVSYLPETVTKFNAYAIHGSGSERVYQSLYPADHNTTAPDFHALQYFHPIDLSSLLPNQSQAPMSQLWQDSLEGMFRYQITTTWDSKPLSSTPVELTLQGFEAGVELNVTAPFYDDPAPSGTPGKPFYGLWDYEVVEMFFLNDNEEYLEVELGPWGEHLLLLLKGQRNTIKHSLPLDYVVTERTDPSPTGVPGTWKGSAMIPPGYFPPNVTRMNAYAIHGVDSKREYQALYPAPTNNPNYTQPDFHRLELFRAIDFEYQVTDNSQYSQMWLDAIGSGATTPAPRTEAEAEVAAVTVLGVEDTAEPATPLPTTMEPTTYEELDNEMTTVEPTTIIPVTIPVPEKEVNTLTSPAPQAKPRRRPPQPQKIDFTVPRLEVPTFSIQHAKQRPRPVPTPQLVRRRGESSVTRVRVPQRTSQLHTGTRRTQMVTRRRGQVATQSPVSPPQQQDVLIPNQNRFHVPGSQSTFQQHHEELHDQQQSNSETSVTKEDQVHDEFFRPQEGQFQSERNSQDHSPQADQEIPQTESFQSSHSQFQDEQTSPEESVGPDQGQLPVDQPTQDDKVQLTTGHSEDQETSQDDPVQPQEIPFEGRQNPHVGFQPDQGQFQDHRRPQDNPFQQGQGQFQDPRRPQHDSSQQGQGQFQDRRRPQHDSSQRGQVQFQDHRRPQHDSVPHDQGQFQDRRPQHDTQQDQGQFQDRRPPQHTQQDQGQFQDRRPPQHTQQGQGQFQDRRPPHDTQQDQGQFQDRRPPHDTQQGQGQFQDRRPPQHTQQDQGQFQDQFEDPREPQDPELHHEPGTSTSINLPAAPDLETAIMEAVVTLAEESPALPPAHPICFQPGLVGDSEKCWVFHECVLSNNTWEVYSWKCMRGHVFDDVSVDCVRGRNLPTAIFGESYEVPSVLTSLTPGHIVILAVKNNADQNMTPSPISLFHLPLPPLLPSHSSTSPCNPLPPSHSPAPPTPPSPISLPSSPNPHFPYLTLHLPLPPLPPSHSPAPQPPPSHSPAPPTPSIPLSHTPTLHHQNDAAQNLTPTCRRLLYRLGVNSAGALEKRESLAWVATLGTRVWGEAMSLDVEDEVGMVWAAGVVLDVLVPRVVLDTTCFSTSKDPLEAARARFCQMYDGYGDLCSCPDLAPLTYPELELKDSAISDVPLVVLASNRPTYLYRCLLTLLRQPGSSVNRMLVVVDGRHTQVALLLQLLKVPYEEHNAWGVTVGARISDHYRHALTRALARFPHAPKVIMLEEDLLASPDFFSYFHQTHWLLDKDPSLCCVSAWSDLGSLHIAHDPRLLRRLEVLPGLGWMAARHTIKELLTKWPAPQEDHDWDIWVRQVSVLGGRECVVPDVTRTFHIGLSGSHAAGLLHTAFFALKPLPATPNIPLLGVDRMLLSVFEEDLYGVLEDEVWYLHPSVHPCHSQYLSRTVKDRPVVIFVEMNSSYDYYAWKILARCLGVWDLDTRGHHRGLFRFYFYDTEVIVIGYPFSDYSYLMSPGLPLLRMNGSNDVSELDMLALTHRARFRRPRLEKLAPYLDVPMPVF
ncbi:hypothetical protein Pmani_035741, partial [Petrolisthes manimaculis]